MTVTVSDPPRRFAFGRNWSRYLRHVTEARLAAAVQSLERVFGPDGLRGRRFLDIGCGSGLFSLAAVRLGATVVSFDFDPESVACAEELRSREGTASAIWSIQTGSVLDRTFLESLGSFDVVYSWGVLHHTGAMWRAIENAASCVDQRGCLWIALYNDQGLWSRVWTAIKRGYQRWPAWLQPVYVAVIGGCWAAHRLMVKLLARSLVGITELLFGRDPALRQHATTGFAASQRSRGMTLWYDLVDWIGGYPFEVARPEAVVAALLARGFQLRHLTTCGGDLGCNEYLFSKDDSASANAANS